MKNQVNRVCLVSSVYTLFIYFLISTEEEIDTTFYFVSDGIPQEVRKALKNTCYFNKKVFGVPGKITAGKLLKVLFLFFLNYFSRIRWPFLRKSDFYGSDHLFFSPGLIGSNHIILIEDGISNYIPPKNKYPKLRFLLKLLAGPLMGYDKFGNNPYCDRIILTGLNKKKGMNYDKRIQWIDINQLWLQSSLKKQERILSIFSITAEDIDRLKGKESILFTQCFSEDHWMTEKEKISMYEGIVKNIKTDKLVIKPHPRETTDYSLYFPDIYVFAKKVPIQLLELIGVRFKTSYTIASTAALSFSYELENVFLGSSYHSKVSNAYGKEVKLSDFQ